MPSGAVTVGGLVINLAAETSQLKTDMAEGTRTVETSAKAMINSMTGVTESTGRATDAGARMVRQLQDEIATFGMSSQELTRYKANLNGVGGEVEALMGRLNQMKASQAGFTDQLAASEAQATQRIKEMVAASMAEVTALNDVAAATQAATSAQAAAISTGRTLAETQKLQILNMQGVAASMRAVQDGTVAMSADTQRILAQYDPLGAKLRALQADLATLRKEMGNSVDPAAIKAFQGLENEISKTQGLMAQAAAQANALGGSTTQLTLTQTQLIERFRQQAETVGMSRSQLMAYQAAQAGVTDQTKAFIDKIKEQEEALKRVAQAKEQDRGATERMGEAVKLLAAGYAALKVGEYIKDATMLAARYETLDVVMGVVGKTAGYTKTQMDFAAESVAKQGITMTESRNSVIKMVQAHIDLSHASALARGAQDAAVIGNINSSEAFERLVNGIARGNVLILRNLGINVNLQTAYAQMANSLGKSTRELTENERVQARTAAVMERLVDINGTYAASLDTASKQITSMKRYTEDLKTTVGEVFTEVLTVAVMGITEGLKDANGEISEMAKNGALAEWGHDLTKVFVGVVNAIDNILTGAKMAGTWAAHLSESGKIDAEYRDKYNAPGANREKVKAAWAAALTQEQKLYEDAQVSLASAADRIERAADERMAARLSKQKASAAERLKVDQDYAKAATDILLQAAGKGAAAEEQARQNVNKLHAQTYVGTSHYRDSEERATKPKVDKADNTRLQDHLERLQKEAAGEKQYTEYLMKLDDMRHKAGEMSDAEYYEIRRNNLDIIAGAEIGMYDKELAALRAHHNSTEAEEAKTRKAINDILDKQSAARKKVFYDQFLDEEEARLRTQKLYDDSVKATLGAGAATIKGLDDEIEKQREHNAEIGKTKEQIELAKQAQVELTTTQLQNDADYLRDGLLKWDLDEKSRALFQIRLTNLDEEITRRRTLAGLLNAGATAEAGAAAAKELDKYLDPTKAEKFGNALKGSLGTAARSMTELSDAMSKFGAQQAANDEARKNAETKAEAARASGNFDQAKYLADIAKINSKNTKEQLASYGNMASAAKGFFKENTTGYKLLEGAEKAFRVMQLAAQMESLYTHLFVTTAKATATIGGQAVETTAVGTGEAARNALKVPGVFMSFMSSLGPYGAAAAAVAIAAVLGSAFSGGGSVNVSKQRQESQGTGTVLGDDSAKSESVKRSIDLIEKNTYQDLAINGSMLATLKSIDSNIVSFASQLVQSTDVTGKYAATTSSFGGGFLGSVMSSIFGGKTSVSDTGFTLSPTSLAQALAGGVNGMQYTDMHKSGGWFSSGKDWTDSKSLGTEANAQFTAIIKSLADSVSQAGALLGVSGDDFTKQLNSFVIDVGQVSLKDLKGDEIQKAFEGVFSKLGDQMAQFAVGGLQEFQQVGEGYLETLVRIASEYQTVDVVFQSFGKTFGSVGLESIAARDRLVQLAGGLDQFTSQGEYFLTNFFSDQEQAAALKARIDPTLSQYGLSTESDDASKLFRDFVVGLDTTTEAGAKAYTALMAIAPAFKTVTDAQKDALQDALDERKDMQDQYDELTMTSIQLREKERAKVADSNKALYDQVQSAQLAKDARALEIQIMGLTGDKVGELAANRAIELAGMSEMLRPQQQRIYDLQDEAAALATSNSLLAVQAQIYELTGNKAGAAVVLQQQHAAALAALDPALRDATQELWNLQAADKAAKEALQTHNSLLALQAQIYELTGDKVRAAAVLEEQHAIALAALDPALRDATKELWNLQAADKGAKDALSTHNSLLSIQAQIYELTGDKAGAAAVLEQQHVNALAALDPALRGATEKLWSLQAAAKATEQVKTDAATLLGGVDGAFGVLQKVVDREKAAVQASIDVHTKSVEKLKSLSDALRSTLSGMQSPEQQLAARADGQEQIRAALARARAGGDLPDADSLKEALSAVQQDASARFSSYTDYLRDIYQTQNDIGDLAGLTDKQLSKEEQALKAAQMQLDSLDAIVTRAQEQIDVLKGIGLTGVSIEQAIQGLSGSIRSAQANPMVSSASPIASAYQQYLGRPADAAGLAWWQNQAAAGVSMASIIGEIKNSAEAVTHVRGYANGGDFAGGVRLVGEIGPEVEATGPARIHSTASLINAMRTPSDNNAVLAAAVQRLTETVARQNAVIEKQGAALEQIQRNTRRQADTLDVVTEGGTAIRTKGES